MFTTTQGNQMTATAAVKTTKPRTIFLLTCFDAEGAETERLVNAESRSAGLAHVARLNKASPADVARVLQAGGRVETAE